MAQKKKKKTHTHTPSVGVFHVSMFCLLSHLCLFCLIFTSFSLLLDFLKPKRGPLNEVVGKKAYTRERKLNPKFRYRRVSRYTPLNSLYRSQRGGRGRAYRSSSCPLEGIAPRGGVSQQNRHIRNYYLSEEKSACNLIWWAVWGFQEVMKQQEIRRNKGKKNKNIEKEGTKNDQQKPPRFCGGFCWPFLTIHTGDFLRFWPFLRPPIEVTAKKVYTTTVETLLFFFWV